MKFLLSSFMLLVIAISLGKAQGVTSASLNGRVLDDKGDGIPGANVTATHVPSGSEYGNISQVDGSFAVPGMRIGGPYTVKISFVGYREVTFTNIYLSLGSELTLPDAKLVTEDLQLEAVIIAASRDDVFNGNKTGAGTNITKEAFALPTLGRSINDFTRLTPQLSGSGSFGGYDSRYTNLTVDGTVFNSSFGIAGAGSGVGGRTGSAPISLDAVEQIQVNIAPYDVRQAGFLGAGVNAVTRSGTNEFSGSVFLNNRNESFVSNRSRGVDVPSPKFNVVQSGFRLGGPIIKNKFFFFVNGELEERTNPAHPFLANEGVQTAIRNTTRVLKKDLDDLSSFLKNKYGYETGDYQGYNFATQSYKLIAKLDYNINRNNKLSMRYSYLGSSRDQNVSNSNSLGGNRTGTLALSYQGSNYVQIENVQSVVGELNSTFGAGKFSNVLQVGYTLQVEDRQELKTLFPFVDILNGDNNYISFGSEPFTPSNKLSYSTFQVQDNFTYYFNKSHVFTAGFNLEYFSFKNVFFPGSQSLYVYNSLADFYADTDDNTTNNPIIRRFQLRYSALEGAAEPVQPTKVAYTGLYIQDEWHIGKNIKITPGIRVDIPFFESTGIENPVVSGLSFNDASGTSGYKINTSTLPKAIPLFSPRIGLNWDVFSNKTLQIRGGSGIFTGRPIFVWISNQIGLNGMITGLIDNENTKTNSFNPNPANYIPANAADQNNKPKSVEIAATDPNFKFPQIWRSNIAFDLKIRGGFIFTTEFLYSQDVQGIAYFNANLPTSQGVFKGADGRTNYWKFPTNVTSPVVRGTAVNRIPENNTSNFKVTSAEVLSNTTGGYATSLTFKLEKTIEKGFFGSVAYNFGVSKSKIDPASIARSTWLGNSIYGDPNDPGVAFNNNDQRHRVVGALGYRIEYGKFGASQFSLFWESRNQGRYSYAYANDMNGDGAVNDLIYVPTDATNKKEIEFEPYTLKIDGYDWDATSQAATFEAYIKQNEYLSSRRGQYVERNGAVSPWIHRFDFSFTQEFFVNLGGKRNTIQLRADLFNVGNLIASQLDIQDKNFDWLWGVFDNVLGTSPLRFSGINAATGAPVYRLNPLNNPKGSGGVINPVRTTYTPSGSVGDVWQAQFGIRYIFN